MIYYNEASMAANRFAIGVTVLTLLVLACSSTVPWLPPEAGQEAEATPEFEPVEVEGCGTLPGDIPVLEDRSGGSGYQGWCSYTTGMDYPAAVEFYRTELEAKGWSIIRSRQSDQAGSPEAHFYGERRGGKLAVGVLYTSRTVTVTLYPGKLIDRPCHKGDMKPERPGDIWTVGDGIMIGFCREEYPLRGSGEGQYIYEYTTVERFDEMLQSFREGPVERGWTLLSEDNVDGTTTLIFKKPGRTGFVQVGIDHFIELPADTMQIQIRRVGEYEDTSVKIWIDNGL